MASSKVSIKVKNPTAPKASKAPSIKTTKISAPKISNSSGLKNYLANSKANLFS
jgi:hypothetical protein